MGSYMAKICTTVNIPVFVTQIRRLATTIVYYGYFMVVELICCETYFLYITMNYITISNGCLQPADIHQNTLNLLGSGESLELSCKMHQKFHKACSRNCPRAFANLKVICKFQRSSCVEMVNCILIYNDVPRVTCICNYKGNLVICCEYHCL